MRCEYIKIFVFENRNKVYLNRVLKNKQGTGDRINQISFKFQFINCFKLIKGFIFKIFN